ncbi:TPA: type IV secretion system protein [Escherichia coli]|nr:type IV secretion system protein [Escherichia coli]
MNIISTFLSTVTTLVESGAASNAAKIANAISPVFFAAIGVYIIFVAYEIIYSQRDVVMSEVTKNIMKLALVGVFTYSSTYYSQYVIPFVMHSGDELSSALTGQSDIANSIDNLWQALSDTMEQFWSDATGQLGMTDFGLWIKAGLIWITGYVGGFLLVFYTTVFLCVSKFMVGMVLSVGILFICFSAFSPTRGMFTAWCGSCLNYILLNVFYTISFGFVLSLIQQTANLDAKTITFMSVATLLAVVLISVYLIEQIGTLCSSLTGGVGINGLTASANGAANKLAAVSGVRAMSNAGKGLAASVAKKAGNRVVSLAGQLGKNVLGG